MQIYVCAGVCKSGVAPEGGGAGGCSPPARERILACLQKLQNCCVFDLLMYHFSY